MIIVIYSKERKGNSFLDHTRGFFDSAGNHTTLSPLMVVNDHGKNVNIGDCHSCICCELQNTNGRLRHIANGNIIIWIGHSSNHKPYGIPLMKDFFSLARNCIALATMDGVQSVANIRTDVPIQINRVSFMSCRVHDWVLTHIHKFISNTMTTQRADVIIDASSALVVSRDVRVLLRAIIFGERVEMSQVIISFNATSMGMFARIPLNNNIHLHMSGLEAINILQKAMETTEDEKGRQATRNRELVQNWNTNLAGIPQNYFSREDKPKPIRMVSSI